VRLSLPGAEPIGRDQPPANPFQPQATTTILTEAAFVSVDGSTFVSEAARFSYAQVLLMEHVWIRDGTYLFGLPETAVLAFLRILSLGLSPRQEPAVYANEDDARCNLST
jgi:hypothetical protein